LFWFYTKENDVNFHITMDKSIEFIKQLSFLDNLEGSDRIDK